MRAAHFLITSLLLLPLLLLFLFSMYILATHNDPNAINLPAPYRTVA